MTDDLFRDEQALLLRHDLRHLDRPQLETLLITICLNHELGGELTALLTNLPRPDHVEEAPDPIPIADELVTKEERRLGQPRP